ncbi:MAG TPA: transcriptional regulator, partial [Candidatus Faecivivens stercoripullorum]|nr:transcriptional regulator [Candidatus Faecivivens stercoripullorum]
MLTRDELPDCPWATAIRLIGNKWKLFILRDLYL